MRNIKTITGKLKIWAAACCGLIPVMAAGQGQDQTDKYFEISKNLEIYSNIFKQLNQYYVDPIEPGKMLKTGVDAMLRELDPYTNLITEADAEDFELQSTGKYSGVGISTRVHNDEVIITDLFENGPVAKAGIKIGDIVTSVNGEPAKGKNTDEISLLMRGAPGSKLTLGIKNPVTGKEEITTITRTEIRLSSVPHASLLGQDNDIGYVYLAQFTPNCSRDVHHVLDSLRQVQPALKGVILDLRNNPGGLLEEAVQVCNLFIPRGTRVVSTKGKNKEWDREFKTSGTPWDTVMSLAILINHGSASASEIVAGTLQDLDRAAVIGTRSFGKGLVQNIRNVGYNSRLKITTAKYYTFSGRCIQALDYSHRNEDGSVSSVPDSLKKQFSTRNGRKVYDGGGIEPDINIETDQLSPLSAALLQKNLIFDYATQYYYKHPTIAQPADFVLNDKDFTDFEKWLGNKDYSYQTDSEELLAALKESAEKEKYFKNIEMEFNALNAKFAHDKKNDLNKNKREIVNLLTEEIAGRYYSQKGRIINKLKKDDKVLDKALSVVKDGEQYKTLLKGGKSG